MIFGVNVKDGIEYLFEPRTIAVIGASSDPDKIGHIILRNILTCGYNGKVYPVNEKGGEILGLKVHRRVGEIEDDVDMAIIVIPARCVEGVMAECGQRGVRHAVVITSGFSEVGEVERERRIVEIAKGTGMRILGPNIFGIYSSKVSLNATFGPMEILEGRVAIITQSGALGVAMIGKTAHEGIGLSAVVSVGNKSDIDEEDLIRYLVEDERTRVIMMYMEGVHEGWKLVRALREATRRKPVVVIKSGRSKRGAMAAASHTGSLAGADDIFDDVMRQCGVIRAENLREAFDWCKFLAESPLPGGEDTVIITNGGGVGVMATDACEKYGVKLYDDHNMLSASFSCVTPEFGSTKNPVDLTGQASAKEYGVALGTALGSSEFNSVIALYCETGMGDVSSMSSTIQRCHGEYVREGKPIVFSLVGGGALQDEIERLRRKGIPVFDDVYSAVSCLGALYRSVRWRGKEGRKDAAGKDIDIDLGAVRDVVSKARANKRHFLLSGEGHAIAGAAGIPLPRSKVAKNLHEAVRSAEEIGYPVVMKIVSKDVIHKSDAGGVALDLENKDEVMDAYQAIITNVRNFKQDASIDGVEVAEMVRPGREVIIGARRDPAFGPVIMFGLGGIYVEVMKDVSFRALPINDKEARGMIKEIRSYALLLGVRGERRKDINAIVDIMLKVGALMERCKDISDIEVNPLVVYSMGEGVKALDIRILLEKPGESDISE